MIRSPDSCSVSLPSCGWPIIFAFELDDSTHLLQPRPHSFTDAIPKCLFPHRASCREFIGWLALCSAWRLIGEVRSDDRRALVVVACIQNQTHCVPDPLGWFDSTEFIQQQHLCFEDWLEDFEFCGLHA